MHSRSMVMVTGAAFALCPPGHEAVVPPPAALTPLPTEQPESAIPARGTRNAAFRAQT